LNIESTKSNLKEYEDLTVFNRGFLPDSLEHSENLDALVWMHIDLNSAKPTVSALECFYDKLLPGGVVLLDDYGWQAYEGTKKAADTFFAAKKGITFPLPTGQAIHFKLESNK
jgi:O-methyltransferase